MDQPNGKKQTIPYPPFKTFLATLDSFANFMPHAIDASVWSSYSGGIKSQLLSTYRFFGLIGENGAPTDELRKLCNEKAGRPALLKEILKRSYGDVMRLDLSKATPNTFDAEMRKYGLEGDTHRKAVAFFLGAAKFSGVKLSPLLTRRGGLAGTRRKRSQGQRRRVHEENNGIEIPPVQPPAGGPAKSIVLKGGITLSLSTSADTFQMHSKDRQFVLNLLEQLEKYESEHKIQEEEQSDEEG